jgi:hypothetical protein
MIRHVDASYAIHQTIKKGTLANMKSKKES